MCSGRNPLCGVFDLFGEHGWVRLTVNCAGNVLGFEDGIVCDRVATCQSAGSELDGDSETSMGVICKRSGPTG